MLNPDYANDILDGLVRGEEVVLPDDVYVSLHTEEPDFGDEEHEVSGNDYSRQTVDFTEPSERKSSNDDDIDFEGMPAGEITHAGLYTDQDEGEGDLLWYGELADSREPEEDDIVRINAGDLTATINDINE